MGQRNLRPTAMSHLWIHSKSRFVCVGEGVLFYSLLLDSVENYLCLLILYFVFKP